MNKYQYVCENYRKPKPILFNTEMVRAILDKRKTQTRRLVKQKLIESLETDKNEPDYSYVADKYGDSHHLLEYAPYQKDDILYVRETFCPNYYDDGRAAYRANYTSEVRDVVPEPKWKPPIHMPKEAARVFLKVIDIRVERLQEISNRDIRSEGVCDFGCIAHRANFQAVWNEIYKEKGYGWNVNPWVWVIEFRRMCYNQ